MLQGNWKDKLGDIFYHFFVTFKGSLTSFAERNASQGGYGIKSNDDIASMEKAQQLFDHPLAVDAVNVDKT